MSLADLYSALADPTRLRVLELLHPKARPVHELAAAFDISRPAISRHLRVLKEAGLVQEAKQGRENLYSLQRDELKAGIAWLETHQRKPGRVRKVAVVEAAAAEAAEALAPLELPVVVAEPIVVAEPTAAPEAITATPAPVPEPVAVDPEPIIVAKPRAPAKPRVAKPKAATEPRAPPPPSPAPQLSLFDF